MDATKGTETHSASIKKKIEAEAKQALNAHKADKDWMAAWMDKGHPKHKETIARVAQLSEYMVAGQ